MNAVKANLANRPKTAQTSQEVTDVRKKCVLAKVSISVKQL